MIKIKINKTLHEIPTYAELTLKQYKALLKTIEDKNEFNLLDYICFITDWNYNKLTLQKVNGLDLASGLIGQLLICRGENDIKLPSIEDLPPKDYFKYNCHVVELKGTKLKSKIGYRIAIEQRLSKRPSYLEIYQYILATILNERINNNFDNESIEQIYNDLDNYNAYHVLSTGAFFLSTIKSGENTVLNYLNRLKVSLLTKMQA